MLIFFSTEILFKMKLEMTQHNFAAESKADFLKVFWR